MTDRLHCTCPYCGRHTGCSEAPPRGLMERTLLRALGFRPYRCGACGHHRVLFVGLGSKPVAATEIEPRSEPPAKAATAPIAPEEDFESLIAKIHRKEESLTEPQKEAPTEKNPLPWKPPHA